ncbi:Vacuolar protein sorting-associated protein 51 [Wickerhamiella sorbophila]|uniref:Vacuolar protein sorting-associated protein 51 homolog n=1 Tax=Wickerhamiella sorbophila TaxID=45607 RepID=A0A2T0FGM5_9ASCO|nr:Vacuolar protein sorting-associated protein 51 [Wickerhamiella sorbophila]PRT54134.1 Vacuolar protein sorting-associated protein 51 [Wickerhamiella sorbophila]
MSGDGARKALRDFYKIEEEAEINIDTHHELSLNHLDTPGLDPKQYVSELLASSSLAELAKTAANLEHEINALDSEQKSLVYNNYKKLIHASETLNYIAGNGPRQGLENLVPLFDEIAQQISKDRPQPPITDFAAKYDEYTKKYGPLAASSQPSP